MWRKRGIYYARIELPGAKPRAMSLRTRDRDEALARRRELERLGDAPWLPDDRRNRTVAATAQIFVEVCRNSCTESTQSMHRQKAAHVERILGDRPIGAYERSWTQKLIDTRLDEGASRHTIAKELTTLRGLLREAMARGWLAPRPIHLLVPRFRACYVPRSEAPSPEEAVDLLRHVAPRRRAWVLLALCGIRTRAIEALTWPMVDDDKIRVPGSKTPRSRRTIPRPSFLAELDQTRRPEGPVVERWTNVRRDLAAACRRAGIPRYTPTDLRRAYASWLRAAGVEIDTIAVLMGHARGSSVTADVYARVPSGDLVQATHSLPDLGGSPEEPGPLTDDPPAAAAPAQPRAATPSSRRTQRRLRDATSAMAAARGGAAGCRPWPARRARRCRRRGRP